MFKVGDIVCVTGLRAPHVGGAKEYVGKVCEITNIYESYTKRSDYIYEIENTKYRWIPDELELVKNNVNINENDVLKLL